MPQILRTRTSPAPELSASNSGLSRDRSEDVDRGCGPLKAGLRLQEPLPRCWLAASVLHRHMSLSRELSECPEDMALAFPRTQGLREPQRMPAGTWSLRSHSTPPSHHGEFFRNESASPAHIHGEQNYAGSLKGEVA